MARVKKENEKIVKLTNSSWTTTLLIWGSIMLVVLVFMSTFVFMRTFRPRVRPPKEKVQSATMAASTLSKVSPTPSTADESLIFEEGYLW